VGIASILIFLFGYFVFDSPQGHAAGGSVNAIQVRDVHKVYRRYSRRKQFATLKSALLSGVC
jgi:hypothetical protein